MEACKVYQQASHYYLLSHFNIHLLHEWEWLMMTAWWTTVTIGELPPNSVSVEIIEPEAEVVDNIRSGNPPRPANLSARDLRPERENQLDSAEAYR